MQGAAHDAVVVGAGPNGLTAAAVLARAGLDVLVVERDDVPGGGTRSAALTLPGFVHDVCSAAHPLGVSSPVWRRWPLADHGLEWVSPEVPVAHPLDGGRAAAITTDLEATAASLGVDAAAWRRTFGPLVRRWEELVAEITLPVLHRPRHPLVFARFGLGALRSVAGLARRFRTEEARALLAGIGAHAVLPLDAPLTGAVTLALGAAAHAVGWPVARGGSGRIADALVGVLADAGGQLRTGVEVRHLDELPSARVVLFDLAPRQVADIAGGRLPDRYRGRLERWRYGPAAFKLDYALDGPVPWTAEVCRRAGTVHVGGSFEEIAAAEEAVARGRLPDRPFVLAVQPTVCDPTRAPPGRHVLWAYCHVPNAEDRELADATPWLVDAVEAQLERFAPGFRDLVLARHVLTPRELEAHDPAMVGGDFSGGSHAGLQLFRLLRLHPDPYRTPDPRIWLCSQATPPGAGVHGMCGANAARSVLRHLGVRTWRP